MKKEQNKAKRNLIIVSILAFIILAILKIKGIILSKSNKSILPFILFIVLVIIIIILIVYHFSKKAGVIDDSKKKIK